MTTFVLSFVTLLFAMFGMAIGVVFGRHAIRGSCGGVKPTDGTQRCTGCGACSGGPEGGRDEPHT